MENIKKPPKKYICEPCRIVTHNYNNYCKHLKSDKHKKNVEIEHIEGEKEEHEKTPPKYYCEKCNYATNDGSNYNKHLKSKTHNLEDNKLNMKKEHICELCNYKTEIHNSYKIHCLSQKHRDKEQEREQQEHNEIINHDSDSEDDNESGNERLAQFYRENPEYDPYENCYNSDDDNSVVEIEEKDHSILEEANDSVVEEAKDGVVKQHFFSQIIEKIKINDSPMTKTDMVQMMIGFEELFKKYTIPVCPTINSNQLIANSNSNNTTNNNTINNNLTINAFLNEQCKDAMNIQEFIDSIEIDINHVPLVVQSGEKGMCNYICSVIKDKLNKLGVRKRPIHCTDQKRKTFRIKVGDQWIIETGDYKIINNMTRELRIKCSYKFDEWCSVNEHKNDQDTKNIRDFYPHNFGIFGNAEKEFIVNELSKEMKLDRALLCNY